MKYFLPYALLFYSFAALGQDAFVKFGGYINQAYRQLGFEQADIKEYQVSSHHRNRHGFTFIYAQQVLESIPIENAIFNLVFDQKGKVVHFQDRWFKKISELRSQDSSPVPESKTIIQAAKNLGVSLSNIPEINILRKKEIGTFHRYQIPELSSQPVLSRSIWILHDDRLKWCQELRIHDKDNIHLWQFIIDRRTLEVLRKSDLVIRCSFDPHTLGCNDFHEVSTPPLPVKSPPFGNVIYKVFPLSIESPSHGMRQLVIDPADKTASPYGWHDIDGIIGPEFTDTRGNNAQVQEDIRGSNSGGDRAEGGSELIFDYDLNFNMDPKDNVDASLTNLFYWVNINHDVFFHYGFDEAAGNYQVKNYSGLGNSGDPIIADALDGGDENNARFFPSQDGSPGRLEMYIWKSSKALVQLVGESDLGDLTGVESGFSLFNRLEHKGPVSGKLVMLRNSNSSLSTVCRNESIANEKEIKGNIVLINRGKCTFVEKVRRMQELGAVAVIVCNNLPKNPFSMAGEGNDITIPAIMLSRSDCFLLTDVLKKGKIVTATISSFGNLNKLDSSLDNLVISHEYGHGISSRLIGGAKNSNCLNNNEQMGEGWSDYFGLMLTTDWSTATPNDSRGIGTWLLKQELDGSGIRPYPYSYSFAINPLEYNDIKNLSVPHGVGTVWCSMLWDMTWNIIAEEGVSSDLYHGKMGNNIALHLVVESLKLIACNPGFVDGRDALLRADQLYYDGKYQYAIWSAFARRGLGTGARQNNPFSTTDGTSSKRLPEQFKTKLISFTAKDSLLEIVLDWTTEREFNNDEFILEKSMDGVIFREIETFPGLEKSLTPRSFKFIDKEVGPGIVYHYRILTRSKKNGSTTKLAEDQAIIVVTDEMAIYPNPIRSGYPITLKIASKFTGNINLELVNASGHVITRRLNIHSDRLHYTYKWEIPNLPAGIYYIRTITESDSFTKKVLIL